MLGDMSSPTGLPIRDRRERHRGDRAGWLRAALLGANDGIVSVSSLVLGVMAAGSAHGVVLMTAVAGTVAGALSMAAGEYVSVRSQLDTERADLAIERDELRGAPDQELEELAAIYRRRGLDAVLADQVAVQLTAHDALDAHARDELGLHRRTAARPLQAAAASAAAFCAGALLPVLAALATPLAWAGPAILLTTVLALLASGALAARMGGAPVLRGAIRVAFWGALAMAVTSAIGRLFHVAL